MTNPVPAPGPEGETPTLETLLTIIRVTLEKDPWFEKQQDALRWLAGALPALIEARTIATAAIAYGDAEKEWSAAMRSGDYAALGAASAKSDDAENKLFALLAVSRPLESDR